jgi:hypothetical protein
MAQRRNSSGRGDHLSDLDDVKAMAAKARSETGGPVLKPNPAELSGLRPRRDSVVGMRLTPPPRATSSELPNWFWGVLGCLSVLLVGFAALFLLGRAGTLGPLLGEAASLLAPAPVPAAPAPAAAPAPIAAEPAAKEPERAALAEHAAGERAAAAEHAAGERAAAAEHATAAAHAAPAEHAVPSEHAAVAAAQEGAGAEKRAAPPAAVAKARAAKTGDTPAPGDQDDNAAAGEAAEAKAPASALASRPARAAGPAPKAGAADDSDDEDSLPGQDDVERALDALSSKVRGCFVKYQIKGTARVRLVAMPAGKAESVNVTGDFEDTPTGLCVESVLTEAKLPTFKGPPLKLSQSYQLR